MNSAKKTSYGKQVVDLLRLEAAAIECAASRIEHAEIERALEILIECRGKVVVIGVGKSGIIAAKIAATLTSTGTVAVSLSPSDALHGGIGVVGAADVVVILSNSGESDEVIALLPSLKDRRVPIIGIIGNRHSTLARNVDVVLDASVDREACALNLAPTASTTVALAIGDALAVALMEMRGWTPEDFARNHPAGRLGKRLTLRVGDLMHSGAANPVVSDRASLLEVVRAISQGGLGAVSVVDERGGLLGIITYCDVRWALQGANLAGVEAIPIH